MAKTNNRNNISPMQKTARQHLGLLSLRHAAQLIKAKLNCNQEVIEASLTLVSGSEENQFLPH